MRPTRPASLVAVAERVDALDRCQHDAAGILRAAAALEAAALGRNREPL